MTAGNAHHIDLQIALLHQLLTLTGNLFQQASAHRAYTTEEDVQHLIFRQEERVVNHVQALSETLAFHHKRDVRLAGSLCASNHADTITAQRAKQLARNAWRMLHVLAHNGHRRQVAFQFHLIHGTHLNLLGKLLVQHLASTVCVIVRHTNRRTVLRRCLTHHEHADAIFCQRGEDATVHTNHTHHRQTAHRDETRVVDRRDAFDGTPVIFILIQTRNDGALILWVERVLNQNRDILDAHRVNRRWIHHLRTEVAQLRCLHIGQPFDGICRVNHPRVCRHEARHIRPNLQHLCIQRSRQNGSRIVAAATSEVGHLARHTVRRDETTSHTHLVGCSSILEITKHIQNQRIAHRITEQIPPLLMLCLDKLQRVIPLGTLNQGSHNVAADALAIRNNRIARLLTQVTNQINTLIDALQLPQQVIHGSQQRLFLLCVCDDCVNHLVVTLHHLIV